jgi:hypothetical protein
VRRVLEAKQSSLTMSQACRASFRNLLPAVLPPTKTPDTLPDDDAPYVIRYTYMVTGRRDRDHYDHINICITF